MKKDIYHDLKAIKKIVEKVSQEEDISFVSQKRHFVFLRLVFYELARIYTKHSLQEIANLCDVTHATVSTGQKNFFFNYQKENFKEYKTIYNSCNYYIIEYYKIYYTELFDNLNNPNII